MNNETIDKSDQQTKRYLPFNIHIGSRIKLQRISKGLSIAELGSFLHISYQRLYYYEEGRSQASSSILYDLSQALDVPVSFFFDGISSSKHKNIISPQHTSDNLLDSINNFAIDEIKSITIDVKDLTDEFYKIKNKEFRKKIIEFLKILGQNC